MVMQAAPEDLYRHIEFTNGFQCFQLLIVGLITTQNNIFMSLWHIDFPPDKFSVNFRLVCRKIKHFSTTTIKRERMKKDDFSAFAQIECLN